MISLSSPVRLTPSGSPVTVLSLPLSPSGATHYVFFANVGLRGALFGGSVTCTLSNGSTLDTETVNRLSLGSRAQLVLTGSDTLSSSATVVLACRSTNSSNEAVTGNITAIQVASLS